jgi:hypothetical protein
MPLKSLKDTLFSAWKVIVAILLVIGGLASLQTLGLLQGLVNSLISLLFLQIPIYLTVGLVAILFGARYLVHSRHSRRDSSSVLTLDEARGIVRLCVTPQTTDFLRSNYDAWERARTVHVVTTYGFDDMMKDLERGKFLEYAIGKWRATRKALATIAKYHGT